jgi:2-polyprenyl-6-methoxyphenol hydroxylase-like FAD-dependent oxidoreductase
MKVGGNIAGLSLAAYCREKYNVTILEKNSYDYSKQATTGISFGGYAKALFTSTCVQDTSIFERAIENTQVLTIRAKEHNTTTELPKEDAVWTISWPDYHRSLSQRIERCTPSGSPATIIRNALVLDAKRTNNAWEIMYDLKGIRKSIGADILIAADGADSTVKRKVMSGQGKNALHTRQFAWRGKLPTTISMPRDMNASKSTLVWVEISGGHILLQVTSSRSAAS